MHYFIKLFTKILPSYQVSQKRRAEECVDMMKLAVCPQNLNKDRMIGFKAKHVLKKNWVRSASKKRATECVEMNELANRPQISKEDWMIDFKHLLKKIWICYVSFGVRQDEWKIVLQ